MGKFAEFVVNHRRKIGVVFAVLVVISLFLMPKVNINYDLSAYVPNFAQAKEGLNVVKDEFGMQSMARIMINHVSLVQAKEYKDKIEKIEGVDLVSWLDDEVDVNQPVEFIESEILEKYYKENSAIFEVMFEEDEYSTKTNQALEEIKSILPEDTNMIGSPIDTKESQDSIQNEVTSIMGFLIPIAIVILLLTTTSWVAPILFITIIAVSILLNMGSNIIFEHVSFLTYSICAALQFAISMDYSVFMLHQFEAEKKKCKATEVAMVKTIQSVIVPILSSSLTTIASFIALSFMAFGIGRDIGFVFSKGILLSLFTVIFLMPFLILKYDKTIEKYRHKSLLPTFEKFANGVNRIGVVTLILVILITIPSYVAQKNNHFFYGAASFAGGEGTRANLDEKEIVEKFGRSNLMLVLVPNESYRKEKEMIEKLEEMDTITKVQSLANLVPEGVPYSFIEEATYQKFQNEKYTRVLIYMNTATESNLAFQTVEDIKTIVEEYYGERYQITGTTPVTMDMKNVIESDYRFVNLLSIVAIMGILLFTFKSLSVPIILTVVIEAGIFINMAIPYFAGQSMIFMGYLIVSGIQLGATIDYAILATDNYLKLRKRKDKKEAAKETIMKSLPSILTSGGILISAGYLIKFSSSIKAVAEMGELIGRGALLSIILVVITLPTLLVLLDSFLKEPVWYRKHSIKRRKKRLHRKLEFKKTQRYKKGLEKLELVNQKINQRRKQKKEKKIQKLNKKINQLEERKNEMERI